MSSLTPGRNNRPLVPTPPPGHPIATYRTYLDAQRAVDYLSDEKFPVQHVSIVGTDLKMVERVTGRLTYARVALAGTLSGAYFGGFVGLLLGVFGGAGFGVVLPAVLIGSAFGIIFGVLSFRATGGRRDFTSTSQIVAAQYAVWCADEHAGQATQVLRGLDGGAGIAAAPAAAPQGSSQPGPTPSGAVQVEKQAPAQPAAPPTGPTYSEMIAKQKAERLEAERLEEERAQAQATPPADGTPRA